MNKAKLIEAIEAYAAARPTNNPTLQAFALQVLQQELAKIPDEETKTQEPKPE